MERASLSVYPVRRDKRLIGTMTMVFLATGLGGSWSMRRSAPARS